MQIGAICINYFELATVFKGILHSTGTLIGSYPSLVLCQQKEKHIFNISSWDTCLLENCESWNNSADQDWRSHFQTRDPEKVSRCFHRALSRKLLFSLYSEWERGWEWREWLILLSGTTGSMSGLLVNRILIWMLRDLEFSSPPRRISYI